MKAEFKGKNKELFTIAYGAEESPVMAVLLQPFPWEMERLSWTYKQLSKRLSRLNILVVNFHYQNTGDSEGKSEDFTIEQSQTDLENLISQYNKEKIILLGTSLGANVALKYNPDPRVLARIAIDPITDGIEYLKQKRASHREYLAEPSFEPPFLGNKNLDGQLLGFQLKPQLEEELKALTISNATTDKIFYTQPPSHTLENAKIIAEDKPLWTRWSKMNFSHFSHRTIKVVVDEVKEVLS
mgnify:CR=1 FL=1